MTTIDFCPAAAAATEVARHETYLDLVERGLDQAIRAEPPTPAFLLARMEVHAADAIEALEAARDRLARAEARSVKGAMAQLLAALRDVRVDDDAERRRAVQLERNARAFLSRTRQLASDQAQLLSRTPGMMETLANMDAIQL